MPKKRYAAEDIIHKLREAKNAQLKRAVGDLTVDKLIFKEFAKGND